MPKYDVRFYKIYRTSDRMSIMVEAASPEEAYEKVHNWALTGDGLTPEEEETETLGREEVIDSEFSCMAEKDDPNAVVEVEDY